MLISVALANASGCWTAQHQAPRAAEVMHHEVHALDPELAEDPVQMRRVAGARVVELLGLVGGPVAGEVGRDRARKIARCGHEVLPVLLRAGVAVHEHDGLRRAGVARLEGGGARRR